MRFLSRLAAVPLSAAALLILPNAAAAHHHRTTAQPVTIQIACFRGPWREIIWDRAEVGFTDSLVAYGYSFAEADAIGTRVCRDPDGVDNPQHMVDMVRHILRTQPPR